MDRLIHQILKASWPLKIGVVAGLSALMTLGSWYFLVHPARSETVKLENRRRKLEGEYIDKQQIANNLNEYRREKAELEAKLAEALTELPQEAAIDDLLRQLHELGTQAELQIVTIEPHAESKDEFYARIPVRMKVSGSYHEIVSFLDEVGRMKRIVNVSGIQLANPTMRNDRVVLAADFTATTFRFLNQEEMEAKKSAAKGNKNRRGRR